MVDKVRNVSDCPSTKGETMAKTRAEINRQNYLRSQSARQEKARLARAEQRRSWRQAIAEWDNLNEWSEPPADWEASGLSQSAIDMAMTDPAQLDWDEDSDAA